MSDIPAGRLVSVFVTANSDSEHLISALDSLFAQTFAEFEAIVVCGGAVSAAEMERILAPYRDRVLCVGDQNRGVAAARNAAVRAARGEWIVSLYPGDIWEPEYLEKVLQFVRQRPELDIVGSGSPATGERGTVGLPPPHNVSFASLVTEGCGFFHRPSLLRRRAMLEVGLFDENLRAAEHLDLCLRIVKNGGSAAYQPPALTSRRRTDDRHTADGSADAGILHILEKTAARVPPVSAEREALNKGISAIHARTNFVLARQAMARRDAAAARAHFEESVRHEKNYKVRLLVGLLRVSPSLALMLFSGLLSPKGDLPRSDESLTAKASGLMIARIFAFAFTIGLPLLIVRRLNQHEFGLYKQVFLVIQTAVSMLPLGFSMTAYYYLPRDLAHQKETISNIVLYLTTIGFLAFAIIASFPSLLVLIFREQELVSYAPLIGAVVGLWIVGSFLEVAPIANQEMKVATTAILSIQIIRTALIVAAAVIFGTVRALVWAALIQAVIQAGFLMLYLVSRFGAFWSRFDRVRFRAQLSYALPLGLAGLLYTFQTEVDNYFVSNRFGAIAFAVYSIGCFELPLMGLVGEAAASVLIPKVSALQQSGNTNEIIVLTLRAARKLSFVAFGLYGYLMVVAYEFIVVLFTSRYHESVPIFRINLTLVPLGIILFDPIMRACAEYRYVVLRIRIGLSVILFGTLWWATGVFGPRGAVFAMVLVGILERVSMAVLFGRVLGFNRGHLALFRDVVLLAGCAVFSAGFTYFVRQLLLEEKPFIIAAVCGVVFAGVYAGTALMTGAVRVAELRSLESMIPRSIMARGRKVLGFSSR